MLASLWTFRHFILSSIRADMRNRFARSRLGALWFILHPLAQALIFSIVLAEVLGARLQGIENPAAYPIYLLSGLAAWTLFSEILTRSITVFIDQASALKKISFPRLSLPLVVWGTALVNHLLLLVSIAVILALFFGHWPTSAWLAIPVGMVLISMIAFGLGVFLGILNVFSRDVAQVMTVVVQLWFWMTPIVYPLAVVPDSLKWVIQLNPTTILVSIYQDAILLGAWPNPVALVIPVLFGVGLVALSFVTFRRASADLVDAL